MKDFNLNNKPKIKTGFQIPNNYFEQFEAKIMEQLPKKEVKIVSLFHRKQVLISSIAAVLLVMIAIPIYFNNTKTNTLERATLETATLETATLETYLANEYSTYDIIDKLTTDDIMALENDLSLNDDAVEAYLLDTQNLDYYLNQ
ncbi:MAG: hypothetical protein HC854_13855 [Flavobacterium sp.]|nr:hypothetical protein [Flavobacterium sp.]